MKARMNEVLGIETGRRFQIKKKWGGVIEGCLYYISKEGEVRHTESIWIKPGIRGEWSRSANEWELTNAINSGIIPERVHPKEVLEKLRALNALGYNWIAMDDNGAEQAYYKRPMKLKSGMWYSPYYSIRLIDTIGAVLWKHEEPLCIIQAIKGSEGGGGAHGKGCAENDG